MIAYYAWTDTQIINCVNLKLNQHAKEEGMLFVLKLKRISQALIDTIIEDKCFSDIREIKYENIDVTSNPIMRLFRLDTLFGQVELKRRYRRSFTDAIGNASFTRLITAGFWAETSFFVKALLKNNRALKIDFIEEGLRHADELFHYTLDKRLSVKILRWFYDGYMIKRWKRLCEYAYFYSPERFDGEGSRDDYQYSPLMTLDEHNARARCILLGAVRNIDITEYQKRSVILLEDVYDVDFDLLVKRVANIVGSYELIVKMHPAGKGVRDKLPDVYYDDRQYLFEGVLIQLQLDEKTIIRGISSLTNNVNFMLKKQSRIITTNRFEDLTALID